MADIRPKTLWRRLEQAVSAPRVETFLGRAREAASRHQWLDAQTLLQRAADALGPARINDKTPVEIESLRLVVGAYLGLGAQVETAAARLARLDPRARLPEVATLQGLCGLGDGLLAQGQTQGAAALGRAVVDLLSAPSDPKAHYLAGRLLMARALGGDEGAAGAARLSLERAQSQCKTDDQRLRVRLRLAELALRGFSDVGEAQRLLSEANPYALDARGRLIYALAFLGSPTTWKRIRALDMLDALADRLGEGASRLLHRQLAALDVCSLSALELDRLQAAIKRLLPERAQREVSEHLRRWLQVEAARREQDPSRVLSLWEEVVGPASGALGPALQAQAKGGAAPDGILGPVRVEEIEDPDVALGCALLEVVFGDSAQDPTLHLQRVSNAAGSSPTALRPMALVLPVLLARGVSGGVQEALEGAMTRYVDAGFVPGYGFAALAELLLALGALELAARAAARVVGQPERGRAAAIIGAAVRRAVERGEWDRAARWLAVLRDPSSALPPR